MRCKNACTFDYEEHARGVTEAMLTAASQYANDKGFEICPVCLREELLSTAAFLHLHCLMSNAKRLDHVIAAERIYKDFCDAAHVEMHKLVDLEIADGGIEPLLKQ
jgi:hypothetical protein